MDDYSIDRDLIERIRTGQDDHFPVLWNKVKPFVYKKANRILGSKRNYGVDLADLEQAGKTALWKAVQSWQPGRVPFFCLFKRKLQTELAIACGYRTKKQAADPINFALSLDEQIISEDGEERSKFDLVPDPESSAPLEEIEQSIWNRELHEALERSIQSALTARQADMIRKHYFEEMSCAEIADIYGCNHSRIYAIKGEALTKLRRKRELQAFLDERTPFDLHVGLDTFRRTRTSAVELLVFKREELLAKYIREDFDNG